MPDVHLADLETIRRYSVAVRRATADLDDVVAALRADLDALTTEVRPKRRVEPEYEAFANTEVVPSRAKRATKKSTTRRKAAGA